MIGFPEFIVNATALDKRYEQVCTGCVTDKMFNCFSCATDDCIFVFSNS